jgi:hypothetical protein|tara:strand:+ start:271 stop:1206 length:936 start_codon:yes stop_codon:yes gene_type:complete
MSGTYITLINSTLARLNEVQLTTGTFANARGIQTQAKNAVNEAIRYINQKEFAYPFNHATETKTLTAGTVRYSLPTSTKHVDYNTFRLVKDEDLGNSGYKLGILQYNDYINNYITQEDTISTTTLDGSLSDSATTVTVASTTGFDSAGTIHIGNEEITYTGTTSTTFTGATRGAGGTTASAHSDATQVAQFDEGGIPRYVVRSPDNNYLFYPFPTKSYSVKFDYYTFPTDLSAETDTTSIPARFDAIIVDGATAFVYQYRGETAQYQLNFARFEQGIKNMQTLLVNKFEYLRSTYIPRTPTNVLDLNPRVS